MVVLDDGICGNGVGDKNDVVILEKNKVYLDHVFKNYIEK